ncbi:NAD-dependent epimerase/dehydratase family protein [Thermovibrio sp.]
MGKKVLITGASGFIAGHLIKELSEEYPLVLISRRELPYPFPRYSPEELERAFEVERPQAVVNTVGILKEKGESTYERAHTEFTEKLVELAKRWGVEKFIQISALGTSPEEESRYFKTKWQAEELVRSSAIPYLILRPSIVLGEGQKLYEDLRKLSRFLPVLAAPKMKVQPVRVERVVEAVKKGIECKLTGTVELCGDRVMSMKELFKEVLEELGIRRFVVELPKPLLLPVALLGLFGLDLEQYKMIKNNTCKEV